MGWEKVGTFAKNMSLPIHRWFKYSAGFSADWVEEEVRRFKDHYSNPNPVVLDPYSGVGTTILAAESQGCIAFGIEAHPFINRVAQTKCNSNVDVELLERLGKDVLQSGLENPRITDEESIPDLLKKAYPERNVLFTLWGLYDEIAKLSCDEEIRHLLELAVISCIRPCSPVGTANWQYVLPNKKKAKKITVYDCFVSVLDIMKTDIELARKNSNFGKFANTILGDSRSMIEIKTDSVDLVVTSPPYPNNFDYADATRLELTFLGVVESWGGLHDAVRKFLTISSSQHASKVKPDSRQDLETEYLKPIKLELAKAYETLAEVRLTRGGKKHYHTMCVSYMLGISQMIHELDRVMKSNNVCAHIVIGDSAPYGVHLPVDKWIAKIAAQFGFTAVETHLRDRNVKWDNRVHKVLLKEAIITLRR